MGRFLLLVGAILGVHVATATATAAVRRHAHLSLRGGDDNGDADTAVALMKALCSVDPDKNSQEVAGLNMIRATYLVFKKHNEKNMAEHMRLSDFFTGLTPKTSGNKSLSTSSSASLACRGGALIPARKRKQVPQKKNILKDKNKSNTQPYVGTKLKQLNQWWYQAPEIARFFVSGNLGNMCFFAIERAVYKGISNNIKQLPPFVNDNKDSISFFLGYILQMGSQHLLHAWLVYGLHTINTREKYIKTLVGQSSAYFTAMIGSTFLNTFLRQRLGVPKNYALFGTLYLFAIINYFVVGWIVHRAVEASELEELELSKKKRSNPLAKIRGGATSNTIGGDSR